MIEQARLWWTSRSRREQRLIGIMACLLVPVLMWLLVIRPLDAALALARADQAAAAERLLEVRGGAEAMRRPRASANEPTQAVIMKLTGQAGLVPTRLDGGQNGRVMLAIASAKPVALRGLLDNLDRQGVFVETIMLRPNSDATIAVDAVLRARGG
jgi:general secretion pathway protein M